MRYRTACFETPKNRSSFSNVDLSSELRAKTDEECCATVYEDSHTNDGVLSAFLPSGLQKLKHFESLTAVTPSTIPLTCRCAPQCARHTHLKPKPEMKSRGPASWKRTDRNGRRAKPPDRPVLVQISTLQYPNAFQQRREGTLWDLLRRTIPRSLVFWKRPLLPRTPECVLMALTHRRPHGFSD
jgi:hypothetical protein